MIIPDWKILGPLMAGLVALFGWLAKHISNTNKHPCKDDIVFGDVCEERGKTNEQAHQHLKEGIENAIARSDEQHKELKADMKTGFGEIKTLIIQNGRR